MKNIDNTRSITFIIVNYKSENELSRCLFDLSSLKESAFFDVVIINNDSNRLNIRKYPFNSQTIYEINKNIGYSKANNIGLSEVKTSFVCFLNPDTHSFSENFAKIVSNITHEEMIVAPKIYNENGQVEPWSIGYNITLPQIIKNNLNLNKKPWLSKDDLFIDWISGAAFFAYTYFIKKLGGFDEDFFLYFEDVDLCIRAKNYGGKIKYLPSYNLIHTSGASSKKNIQNKKKCYYNSQDIFFKKHLSTPEYHLMRALRFLAIK